MVSIRSAKNFDTRLPIDFVLSERLAVGLPDAVERVRPDRALVVDGDPVARVVDVRGVVVVAVVPVDQLFDAGALLEAHRHLPVAVLESVVDDVALLVVARAGPEVRTTRPSSLSVFVPGSR